MLHNLFKITKILYIPVSDAQFIFYSVYLDKYNYLLSQFTSRSEKYTLITNTSYNRLITHAIKFKNPIKKAYQV